MASKKQLTAERDEYRRQAEAYRDQLAKAVATSNRYQREVVRLTRQRRTAGELAIDGISWFDSKVRERFGWWPL